MFTDINDENYRLFPAVSNSDLKWLGDYWKPTSYLIDCTKAFAEGTLIDCMITEAHKVDYFKYQVAGERYQYTRDQFENSKEMKRQAMKDPLFVEFIKRCSFQHITYNPSFKITYEGFEFEIPAKCKWDLLRHDIDLGGDIKSTTATTQKQCEEAVRHFDYDQSRAYYMDLGKKNNDMLFFISKKNYKVFKVPIRRGDQLYKDGLKKYQEKAFQWWYLFGQVPETPEYKMFENNGQYPLVVSLWDELRNDFINE